MAELWNGSRLNLHLAIAFFYLAFGPMAATAQDKTIFVSKVKSNAPFHLIISENDSRDTVYRIDTAKEFQFTADNSTKLIFYNNTDTISYNYSFNLVQEDFPYQWSLHAGKNKGCLLTTFAMGSDLVDSIYCNPALKEAECKNCSAVSFADGNNDYTPSTKPELWKNIELSERKKPVKK